MKVLLFANTDWYLYNFRLSFARYLRELGYEVVLVSPAGEYGTKLAQAGFRWIPVQLNRRSLNPVKEILFLRQLTHLYESERPDLVHHFTIKCVVYGGVAARLAKIPAQVGAVAGMGYVFTSRALRAKALRPIVRTLLKSALDQERGMLVVQNSDDLHDFVRANLVSKDRVALIHGSGVDMSRFLPRQSRTNHGPLRILFAARLLRDKGLYELMDAIKMLVDKGLELDVMIAGTGDAGNPASIPDKIIDQWRTEGLANFLGHVSDMPSLLAKSDVMVLPSYREGFPKSLIEAAAVGLPIITTDVPGCREVVDHGLTGLLVPVRDAKSLARAIQLLALNPQLRRQMGEEGRHKARAEFDQEIVFSKTHDVYAKLLPSRTRHPSQSSDPTLAMQDMKVLKTGVV